jgi:hypothetical protein
VHKTKFVKLSNFSGQTGYRRPFSRQGNPAGVFDKIPPQENGQDLARNF